MKQVVNMKSAFFASPLPVRAGGLRLPWLDRVVVGYVAAPLVIFLWGWFQWWASVPMIVCVAYGLRSVLGAPPALRLLPNQLYMPRAWQLALALLVACVWGVLGGTAHVVYANPDWLVRDALLHDLVVSSWPVGYGLSAAKLTILRAPIGYFLPAALVGKVFGLASADWAMLLWTIIGVALFLTQVLSLLRPKLWVGCAGLLIVVLFSGMDIVGAILNRGAMFYAHANITTHLEWWALRFQYSSMTTQLFWVPNHALGGWLLVGLVLRYERSAAVDALLPVLVVATLLWSPLMALGLIPFLAWKVGATAWAERSWSFMHPRIWLVALPLMLVVMAYIGLDPGAIPKGWSRVSGEGGMHYALRHAQFVLLEAGLIAIMLLALRVSAFIVVAFVVLALLPVVFFGPGNDLVMRASIPALVVLAIASARTLTEADRAKGLRYRVGLCVLLAIGAVTPMHEFARAFMLPVWPRNAEATIVGTNCGAYPAHYIARLSREPIGWLLREPQPLAAGPLVCSNRGLELMWQYN
jgi:hypothetical protein